MTIIVASSTMLAALLRAGVSRAKKESSAHSPAAEASLGGGRKERKSGAVTAVSGHTHRFGTMHACESVGS